jgi:Protein phosphatase 2C
LCEVLTNADGGPVLVAVAADGAGSARHGGIGAGSVCESVLGQCREFLAKGGKLSDFSTVHAVRMLDEVREVLVAEAGPDPLRDYASTLLFAIVGADTSVFGQIGDGAIVTGQGGTWKRVFQPERGMYANETYFVTQDNAAKHLQFVTTADPVTEVSVFTDGLERLLLDIAKGDAHPPVFEKMFAPLRAHTEPCKAEVLSEALGKYLASPAVGDRTDDDVTLLIARRL